MNCSTCGQALTARMHYCPRCGAVNPHAGPLVAPPSYQYADEPTLRSGPSDAQTQPSQLPAPHTGPSDTQISRYADKPTIRYGPQAAQENTPLSPPQPFGTPVPPQGPLSPFPPPDPLPYHEQNNVYKGGEMAMTTDSTPSKRARPSRNRAGCFVGCLTILVLLLLIIGGGFIFFVRPAVQAQLDQAMGKAVQQVPEAGNLLSAGPLTISDNTINNLIVLNLAPSDPIKNPNTTITPQRLRLSFQAYGQNCAISLLPQAQNGQIKVTNVQLEGPIQFFISPDELATMMDRHLAEAQNRLGHTITGLQVQNNALVLDIGAATK